MSLYAAIKYLKPQANDRDFRLQDDGDGLGPKIAYWNYDKLGVIPTPEELFAADTPPPTIQQQILALEASVTPRRIREAVFGVDGGWLASVDSQIAALRAQL